jgi:hypothetical protein
LFLIYPGRRKGNLPETISVTWISPFFGHGDSGPFLGLLKKPSLAKINHPDAPLFHLFLLNDMLFKWLGPENLLFFLNLV